MPIFGAKSRAMRGCASKLACGHRIGPADCTILTVIFGEFATSQRAAVGIGPYIEKGKRLRIRPEFPKNLCLLLGPTESSAPTG